MCIFLTNVLQNLRERISARYKTCTYPIPASTQCRATIGLPGKCHSNVFKKGRKEGGDWVWWGGGGGDQLESPVETHSILVVFFACVVVVFCTVGGGGGVNC